jgi:tetratricopeptide (TPR) repeat protein
MRIRSRLRGRPPRNSVRMALPPRYGRFLPAVGLCVLLLCIPVANRVLAINSASLAVLWATSELGDYRSPGQRVLRLVPKAERDRLLGRLFMAQGQDQAAVEALSRAIEADPADRLLLAYLGQALDNLGQSPQAIEAWRRAGDVAHLLRKGEQAIEAGQWAEAQASLEVAWTLAPGTPEIVRPLVRVYQAQGEDLQAAAVLRRALAVGPRSQATYYRLWLGQLLEGQGEWAQAEAVYRQILATAPEDPQAHAGLARSLHSAGSALPEVQVELEQAKDLDPARVEAYMSEGKILRAEGRHQEALASYQRAAELAPGNFWPVGGQAEVLMDMGDPGAALGLLLDVESRFPGQPHLYYLLAYAYRGTGDIESAVAAAERSVSLNPEQAGYLWTLARMCEAAGRSQDALAAYEDLLVLDPDHQDALEGIARLRPSQP